LIFIFSTKESTSQKREEEIPMDLYNLLSVSRTATDREIKRAYLLKAKELHPDRNPGDKKCEELFKKVNQAYAILSDKYKREQYDKYGYESVKYS
jgi:curved DNA-binding protein CbpA